VSLNTGIEPSVHHEVTSNSLRYSILFTLEQRVNQSSEQSKQTSEAAANRTHIVRQKSLKASQVKRETSIYLYFIAPLISQFYSVLCLSFPIAAVVLSVSTDLAVNYSRTDFDSKSFIVLCVIVNKRLEGYECLIIIAYYYCWAHLVVRMI